MRWAISILAGFFFATGFASAQQLLADKATYEGAVKAFIEEHCVRCHGPEKQKGKLRLDDLAADFLDSEAARNWVEVMDNINLGEMPPEDEPIPDAD
ncbi:MAG: mono/diheme cytochrome c family protein, partial [Verrucomicrobiales bacterium]